MSEAGERNKGDLLEEMAAAMWDTSSWSLVWVELSDDMKKRAIKEMAAAIGVLLRRGYLTEAGIIAAKAIDDGA